MYKNKSNWVEFANKVVCVHMASNWVPRVPASPDSFADNFDLDLECIQQGCHYVENIFELSLR